MHSYSTHVTGVYGFNSFYRNPWYSIRTESVITSGWPAVNNLQNGYFIINVHYLWPFKGFVDSQLDKRHTYRSIVLQVILISSHSLWRFNIVSAVPGAEFFQWYLRWWYYWASLIPNIYECRMPTIDTLEITVTSTIIRWGIFSRWQISSIFATEGS